MHDLVKDGNSVVLVDHDTQVLRTADWIVEMGPGAGSRGGQLIAQGTPASLAEDPHSLIGPFLCDRKILPVREEEDLFAQGTIRMRTGAIHHGPPVGSHHP